MILLRQDSTWLEYGDELLDYIHFNKGNYDALIDFLHTEEYTALLEGDDNRLEDGLYLRKELGFWFDRPCSVLEMMVAFAQRIELEFIGEPGNPHPEIIFWEMIKNLDLDRMTNDRYDYWSCRRIVQNWMNRKFDRDGDGSIFPLKHPSRDQRYVDLWGQMLSYVTENY